jgi:hypothetical protein
MSLPLIFEHQQPVKVKIDKQTALELIFYTHNICIQLFELKNKSKSNEPVKQALINYTMQTFYLALVNKLYSLASKPNNTMITLNFNYGQRVAFSYIFINYPVPHVLTHIEFEILNNLIY